MNDEVDSAKHVLAAGGRVEIKTHQGGFGYTIAAARESDDHAKKLNAAGQLIMNVYANERNDSRISSSAVDRAAARDLIRLGAQFIGREDFDPTDAWSGYASHCNADNTIIAIGRGVFVRARSVEEAARQIWERSQPLEELGGPNDDDEPQPSPRPVMAYVHIEPEGDLAGRPEGGLLLPWAMDDEA